MAAYHGVYDLHHLQADCQELGLAPEPYARQSSMHCLYFTYEVTATADAVWFVDSSGLREPSIRWGQLCFGS